jgi:hypothetical protein
MKMEVIRSSEESVLTRPTRRHVPENGILYSHSGGDFNLTKTNSVALSPQANYTD